MEYQKLLILFDNTLGPIPLYTHGTEDLSPAIKQKIALNVQQTMSMSNKWDSSYFESIVQVDDYCIYAFTFIVPSDQHERLQGETLGTLCYCLKSENVPNVCAKAEKLRAKAKEIKIEITKSFVYYRNGENKNKLSSQIESLIQSW